MRTILDQIQELELRMDELERKIQNLRVELDKIEIQKDNLQRKILEVEAKIRATEVLIDLKKNNKEEAQRLAERARQELA